MLTKAIEFARAAHAKVGQRRKYTDEPYIVHPIEVMGLLVANASEARFRTEEVLAAAVLHDTVEDTDATFDDIVFNFGPLVGSYVHGLTDQFTAGYIEPGNDKPSNRARRKLLEFERLIELSPEVHTIKLADLISNTRTIVTFDPGFAVGYLKEKRRIVEDLVIRRGQADRVIGVLALDSLVQAEATLKITA